MKINLSNIKKSKKILDSNDCIGIPTETVYGLAGNAYSDKAVSRIFELKKRPKNNPLIVHYISIDMLKNDCEINNNFKKLYKKFCPGPITFILKLKKSSHISKYVSNNKNTLAVRFPKHLVTRKLLSVLDYPLAAPSANISNSISSVSKEDVKDEFGNKVKFVLNGGRSSIGLESTIVSLIKKPEVLRLGGIEIKKINKILKKKMIFNSKNIKVKAPGQNKFHYSPGIPIKLNVKIPKKNDAYILIEKRKASYKNYYYLTKNKNLKEAAKNLYKVLRMIKNKNYPSISVEKIPNHGFGEAINERLYKASKLK